MRWILKTSTAKIYLNSEKFADWQCLLFFSLSREEVCLWRTFAHLYILFVQVQKKWNAHVYISSKWVARPQESIYSQSAFVVCKVMYHMRLDRICFSFLKMFHFSSEKLLLTGRDYEG